jgi:hypothetical protein
MSLFAVEGAARRGGFGDIVICAGKIEIDICGVNPPESSPLAKGARMLMLVILIAMLVLSLYANVQRWRREKIETATFAPATAASPSISPSVSPK